MRKAILFIAIGLIVIGIIIFEPFRSAPPSPEVSTENTGIPLTQGSYCWMGLLRGQCVDYVYTTPMEMAQKHNPTIVSPNEEVTIDFKKKPISKTLQVNQWIDENNVQAIQIENDVIRAPNEKGIYIYHVVANWKQGDGNWAFSIEVE
ncbi:hypothetical protein [Planococcus sp. YIM B11945]|uniref:hypothetical protein n=1 Tax=Planococcus sp. YIM B11945 TaxID=3435410 RepID=UPI003D7C8BB6